MAPKTSKSKKVTVASAEKVSKKGRKINLVKDVDVLQNNDLIKSDNEESLDNHVNDLKPDIIEEKVAKKEKKRTRKVNELLEEDHVVDIGKGDENIEEEDDVTNKKTIRGKRANKKTVKIIEHPQENGDHNNEEVETQHEEMKTVKGKKGKQVKKELKAKPTEESHADSDKVDEEIEKEEDNESVEYPSPSKGRKAKKRIQKVKPSKGKVSKKEIESMDTEEQSPKDDSPKKDVKTKTSKTKVKTKSNNDAQSENIDDMEVEKKESKTRGKKGKQNIKEDIVVEAEKNDSSKENIDDGMGLDEVEISKPTAKKGKEPKRKGLKAKKDESSKHDVKGDLDIEEETTQFGDDNKSTKSKGKRGKNAKTTKDETPPNPNLDIEEETMDTNVKENLKVEQNSNPKAKGKKGKAKGKKNESPNVKTNLEIEEETTEFEGKENDKMDAVSEIEENSQSPKKPIGRRHNKNTQIDNGKIDANSDVEENSQSEQELEKPKDKRGNKKTQVEDMEEDDNKGKRNNIKRKPKDKQVEEEPSSKKTKTEENEAVQKETKKKAPPKNKATTDYEEIDFSNSSKNDKGQEWNFKIANWNIDGIRAWLTKGGLEYIKYEKPDILCLQEIKCSKDKMPDEVLNIPGYHTYYECGKTDGYAGVAICTSNLAMNVQHGLNDEELDGEGRIITAEYEQFFLICTYVPNAGRKLVTMPRRLKWNEEFRRHVKELDKQKPVIICGDMNVAHNEIDLSNPKTNRKNAGFTDEERAGMTELLGDGFIDTFRHLYPDKKDAYTFWTYMMNSRAKNVGWRLDYFIISERLLPSLCDNVIRSQVFGSDHCPLSLFLHLTSAVKPKPVSS